MSRAEAVLTRIQKSPFYQKLEQEEREKVLDRRKDAYQSICEIEADLIAKSEKSLKKVHAAERRALDAEKVAADLRRKATTLKHEHGGLSLSADSQKRKHERFLLGSYDGRIDSAIEFFQKKRVELMKRSPTQYKWGSKVNPATMDREKTTASNIGVIRDALSYSLSAIQILEKMKLEPVLNNGKLVELAKGLPDPLNPDNVKEFKGKQRFRDNADLPFWARFKSEDQENYELGKLNEKIEKVMKKPARRSASVQNRVATVPAKVAAPGQTMVKEFKNLQKDLVSSVKDLARKDALRWPWGSRKDARKR